jgi:trimeric autotransporter adhesin
MQKVISWTCGVVFTLVLGVSLSTVSAQVPQQINTQGRVSVDGTNFNGTAQFQFALVDGIGMVYWTNGAPMDVTVTKGLYSVALGDTSLMNMDPLPADVFTNSDVRLRVTFDDGIAGPVVLSPDSRIASVGYALMAYSVEDGAITTAKIADKAVGTEQLAQYAVTGDKIEDESVDEDQLSDDAVSSDKIQDDAISSAKIADGSIVAADMDAASFSNIFWKTDGNVGTTAGTHFLGTTDNQALEIMVNNQRALRIDPDAASARLAAGYSGNAALAAGSVVAGGGSSFWGENRVSSTFSFIGSGVNNLIATNGGMGSIVGGQNNVIESDSVGGFIGGGYQNVLQSNSYDSVIAGGEKNQVGTNTDNVVIGGGLQNEIAEAVENSVIAGGWENSIGNSCSNSVIGGGAQNRVDARYSVIAGGSENIIATNTASGSSTISGGTQNTIQNNSSRSTIAGGYINQIGLWVSGGVIGGGALNQIQTNSDFSTIGGGNQNIIQSNANAATIAGGYRNTIQTNANYSIIPGGSECVISNNAQYAFAAGRRTKAGHAGTFVWADSQNDDFGSTTSDEVSFRCQGGVRFNSGAVGANQEVAWVPGDASWTFTSDEEKKEGFQPVDTAAVLQKVAELPISWWVYKGYDVQHIGPMAQDFHAAFDLGRDKKGLDGADLDGVALAAIQGLAQETVDLKARVSELERKVDLLMKQMKP